MTNTQLQTMEETSNAAIAESKRFQLIRFAFWFVGIFVAAAQAWVTRHSILSDGISYIEIAQAYLHHDWPNAINAYWSPLYSWLLAALFAVLQPPPYWQAAVAHLALFVAFVASIFAFEYFLHSLWILIENQEHPVQVGLSRLTLYIGGYSAFLFAGLSLVGLGYCSPDMISFALTFYLCGAVLRIQQGARSDRFYILFGLTCGLFFLARTAFSASFLIFLAVVISVLWQQRKPLIKPSLLILCSFAILVLPFVIAISWKHGSPTIGESGKLNYGWELGGAHRWIDWQGEPFHNIGFPKHPTVQVLDNPRTFTFDHPIAGSYPPWYDPSYWYDGIRPTLNPSVQLKALLINLSVACNYFVRSPIAIPALLLAVISGALGWSRRMRRFWPVLLPMLCGIGLYCLIYFEKRYVSGNLVVIWVLMLAALRFSNATIRRAANIIVVGCALLYIAVFVGLRQRHAVNVTLTDLLRRHESELNPEYFIAQRLHAAGLKEGDAVAYIGPGINADWARLAGVRIVAEVPLMYKRTATFLNDTLIDDDSQVKAFWHASDSRRQQVLAAFAKVGAKMVVTDGFFCSDEASAWPRILPANQPGIAEFNKSVFNDVNSRFLILGQKEVLKK